VSPVTVAVNKSRSDLAFIYWQGPGLDAFDWYERLRAIPDMEEIPVIFMGMWHADINEKLAADHILGNLQGLCSRVWGKGPKEFLPKLQRLGVRGCSKALRQRRDPFGTLCVGIGMRIL
jgi:hypothetical protein